MKHFEKNPRQITKKQFADLQFSLDKFGDLSGVVHNLMTDEIVGGNQRMDVFDLKHAQIEIVEQFDAPDPQGTVARGWVVWKGFKYTYRAVMWTPEWADEANIRANKNGGTFDSDKLANFFEVPSLLAWGFETWELGISDKDDDEKPEDVVVLDQAIQIKPNSEYVVILCDSDEDWDYLKTVFKLPFVRRGGYKKGSPFDHVGIQRVITLETLRMALNDYRDSE